MGKLTKNQKKAQELLEVGKEYSLEEASKLVKEITFTGNKEIDDEDLGEIVTAEVKVGEIINHAAIRRAVIVR